MSTIQNFPAVNYAFFDYSIPAIFAANSGLSKLLKIVPQILSGPLPPPTFDQFVSAAHFLTKSIRNSQTNTGLVFSTGIGRQYENLAQLGTLHVSPAGPVADAFVAYATSNTTTFGAGYFTHRVHATESEAVSWIVNHPVERAWALIVFNSMTPGDVEYTLRLNYTTVPDTSVIVNFISIGLDKSYQQYYTSGFLSLRSLVDQFAFEHTRDISISTCQPPSWVGVPFPTPQYSQNVFYLAIGYLLGLVLTMVSKTQKSSTCIT